MMMVVVVVLVVLMMYVHVLQQSYINSHLYDHLGRYSHLR
jgi:hypothetical protein